MRCAEVREALPGYVRDGEEWLALRRHVSRCPGCKAELARYEALEEALSSLTARTSEPPPELVTSLVAIGARRDPVSTLTTHLARNRSRYTAGVAVTLAGVAGAALWRTRGRRLVAA